MNRPIYRSRSGRTGDHAIFGRHERLDSLFEESPFDRRTPVATTPASDIAVCSIVWAELLHGARKYEKRSRREELVYETLAPYRSFAFDDDAARKYARIRDALEIRGDIIGLNDLLIASIALVHDLTVITNNVGEFRRVDGLQSEDWSVV